MRQPIKYHGGKYYLAKFICDIMPDHLRYVETHAGGLSVLLRKDPEGCIEYANDIDSMLANFWHVLSSEKLFKPFARIANCVPLSEEKFDQAKSWIESLEKMDLRDLPLQDHNRVSLAVSYFIMLRQSRQGLRESYCTPTKRTRRGMNENVSAWLSAVEGLPEVHARMMRVEVLNRDAVELIKKMDAPDTLFYCDPPYLHSTRVSANAYASEMTVEQHRELLTALTDIEGHFILSGYRSGMYDQAAWTFDMYRTEFDIDNKASSSKTKEKKVECLWTNFKPEPSLAETRARCRIVNCTDEGQPDVE